MPALTLRDALNAPLKNRFPAPDASEPIPKCVIVSEPEAQAANVIAAALLAFAEAMVQPAPDRATATRAYGVYVASVVF